MKESNKYIAWLLLSFIIAGVVDGLGINSTTFAQPIIVAILVFAWCGIHAIENEITMAKGYRIFSAVIPVVGVPIYFFRYFGFIKGLMKTLKAFGVLVAAVLIYTLSVILVEYVYA